jgi:hypothetical protein
MPHKVANTLTPRAAEAADIVRRHPGMTRAAVAKHMMCCDKTAGVHLDCARRMGLVEATRHGTHGAWWPVGEVGSAVRKPLQGGRVSSVFDLGARL